MSRNFICVILALVAVLLATNQPLTAQKVFTRLQPNQTGLNFKYSQDSIRVSADSLRNLNMMVPGCGVAVVDIDGDGLQDLVFTSYAGVGVYKNNGGLKFTDVTLKSGILRDSVQFAEGVTYVDIDADGDQDLFITRWNSTCRLYINDGKGVFTERAAEFGLDFVSETTHSVFFDYDKDGLVDCYLVTYSNFQRQDSRANSVEPTAAESRLSPTKARHRGVSDRLFKNLGNNRFVDVSEKAGIQDVGMGLSATVGDINLDGWPDIYVANDFNATDLIYINNKDGTFTQRQHELTRRASVFSMGSDIADINNDGFPDIITTDMLPYKHVRRITNGAMTGDMSIYNPTYDSNQISRNMVHLNRGDGTFSDIGYMTGMAATDWSWACLIADYNNDGHNDVFIANGYASDITNQDYVYNLSQSTADAIKADYLREQDFMFKNNGDLGFDLVSDTWGIDEIGASFGAAYGDLDNDGDLDLVVVNLDKEPAFYKNNTMELRLGKSVRFSVVGPKSNPNGFGARVKVVVGKGASRREFSREHYPVRGFQSSVDGTMHVGVGDVARLDSVFVEWPDGKMQVLTNLKTNQSHTLKHVNAKAVNRKSALRKDVSAEQKIRTDFVLDTTDATIKHLHYENYFDDFKRYRLAPTRISWGGPSLAVADLDNNGTDDIVIGGAMGKPTSFYYQNEDGSFQHTTSAIVNADTLIEDQAILAIDLDNDGIKELLVAGGGPEFADGDPARDLHIFKRREDGKYVAMKGFADPVITNATTLNAVDYDGDGYLDLFVGGGVLNDSYPFSSPSYILHNEGGKYLRDVTDSLLPELRSVGIVRSALWTDVNNDNAPDLILVGEWMPVTVFLNTEAGFINATEKLGLQNTIGWWYSINGADVDNDGDIDYILGNMGLNSRYRGTPENPIELFAADFDENGSVDALITYKVDGERCLVRDRAKIFSQMPTLNRKFNKYKDFANALLTDVVDSAILDTCYHRSAVEMRSLVLLNNGEAPFTIKPLPMEAQISPILGTLCMDINDDTYIDLVTVGNMYGAEDDVVRYDAGKGLVLYGDGQGAFQPVKSTTSGFTAQFDTRGIALIANSVDTNVPLRLITVTNQGVSIMHGAHQTSSRTFDSESSRVISYKLLVGSKTRMVENYYGSGYRTQGSVVARGPAGSVVTDVVVPMETPSDR